MRLLGLHWRPHHWQQISVVMAILIQMSLSLPLSSLKLLHSGSPAVEVIMNLPAEFSDIDAFRTFLGVGPERRRRDTTSRKKREVEAPVTPSATAENPAISEGQFQVEAADIAMSRPQREALLPQATIVDSPLMQVAPSAFMPNLEYREYPDAVLALAQQGSSIQTEPDPDDPRRRRNTSDEGHEGKRSYVEQDSTTTSPFWKHKKANPPFVTTREGRQGYDQAQHRSGETARESHSLKDLGKSVSSNEINRMSDSYYSASNNGASSRAYTARPGDTPPPKSVYDTIDYSRRGQARNADTTARGRLTQDAYSTRPYPYDRYNYNNYPLGPEVAGRGVEYYHRSTDPGTGRIIYYASLPDPETYRRTYTYDTYGRSLQPAYSSYPGYQYQQPYYPYYQPYAAPVPDYSRSARYQQVYRSAYDEPRNKTYVIYDAEENKRSLPYPTTAYETRYTPPLPYPSFAAPVSYQGYQPYPTYTPYNSYSPYSNSRSGYPQQRGIVTRNVDLPLSTTRTTLRPVSV